MSDAAASASAGAAARPETLRALPGRVTLRTLVLIRWVGVAGQLAAVGFVRYGLDFPLPLPALLLAIAASALVNLLATLFQRGRRLSDGEAAALLGFDLVQLTALLYLTGGSENPFVVLLTAPVTVGAGILGRRSAAWLTLAALACLALLTVVHHPLPWSLAPDAQIGSARPLLPGLYLGGEAVALGLSIAFLAAYNWSVAGEARRIADAAAVMQAALAREQQRSALGALAAAAAHELGSPLSTIAVIAKELGRDVPRSSPFAEDVALLQSEVDRCRAILAELSRRPEPPGTAPFDTLPLTALAREAAAPHRLPRIALDLVEDSTDGSPEPLLPRSPELIYGLGNLLQNATQFATAAVTVTAHWSRDEAVLEIEDDGPGFPAGVLGRLGEPYVSGRGERQGAAAPGAHLGLGIFIAQTLLERTGAALHFGNGPFGGARVVCTWRPDPTPPLAQRQGQTGA